MSEADVIDILLVEDNPTDVELTLRALRQLPLLNVLHLVSDGAEALDFLLRRERYATRSQHQQLKLVLLDLDLPRLSGLDVLKVIKSDETLRLTPVVMLTSSREDADVKTAYEYGANSYVTKPVEFEKFVDAVSQIGNYWLRLNTPPL